MKLRLCAALLALALLGGCSAAPPTPTTPTAPTVPEPTEPDAAGVTDIALSDEGVTCASDAVYADSGEGAYTIVHITAPGTYRVTGTLSAGQLLVNLGEEAEADPAARVTLMLDQAQLSCAGAPAILFSRVYEGAADEAGAVLALADGSFNLVDGTVVSQMSMRLEGDGSLTVNAAGEGLSAARKLTLDGGNLTVAAQGDGIRSGSALTVNGGFLSVAGGRSGEGDGLRSGGTLALRGGTVFASGSETSGSGLAADGGISLDGSTVVAAGAHNDAASNDSLQQFMELHFAAPVPEGSELCILNGETALYADQVTRAFSSLTFSAPELETGVAYTVTVDGVVQQHGAAELSFGKPALDPPPTEHRQPGEFEIPEPPGGMNPPVEAVENVTPSTADDSARPAAQQPEAASRDFLLTETVHRFSNVRAAE